MNPILGLVKSRKFLITLAALIACTVLVAIGKLTIHDFVTTLTVLVSVLTGAIALEDHASKSASNVAAGGDIVIEEKKQ